MVGTLAEVPRVITGFVIAGVQATELLELIFNHVLFMDDKRFLLFWLAGLGDGQIEVFFKLKLGSGKLKLVDFAPRFETHDEIRADSKLALDVDRAAVSVDDFLGDAQSEANPLFVLVLRILELAEVVEKALLVFFRDADACVFESHLYRDVLLTELLALARKDFFVGSRVLGLALCVNILNFGLALLRSTLFWDFFHLRDLKVDRHGAVGVSELNRVRHEVQHNLAESSFIAENVLQVKLVERVVCEGTHKEDFLHRA